MKKLKSIKNAVYEFNRNNMYIKSPKKTSPGKSRKDSERKIKDKNKITENE